ncbi:hypothetical protein ACI2KR_09355 [Pseudomonas luteola]
MKIEQKVNDIHLSNVNEGIVYGLENVSMAAHVLTTNIYSHHRRQEAVLRELSTNAFDSHNDAGKPLEPIHVHLPTATEPYLLVEDFGVGLFSKDVEVLIGTFFKSRSSQQANNNGVFGVGAKSPFAYTSMFTVESVKNGTLCLYQCYKDEEDRPRMTPMLETHTDRPNGIVFNVPVEASDIGIFESEAIKLYQHTSTIPRFSGVDVTQKILALRKEISAKVSRSGDGWKYVRIKDNETEKLFSKVYNNKNCNSIVLGGVSYPLDFKTLSETKWNRLADLKLDSLRGLVIELDVASEAINLETGREKLQYTERTCQVIEKRIRKIIAEVENTFSEVVNGMSQWEVISYVNDELQGDNLISLALGGQMQSEYEFGDLRLGPCEIKRLRHDQMFKLQTQLFVSAKTKQLKRTEFNHLTPSSKYNVIVKTSRQMTREKISNYMIDAGCNMLVIEGTGGKTIKLEDASDLLAQLGNPPLVPESKIIDHAAELQQKHIEMINKAQAVPLLKNIKMLCRNYGVTTRDLDTGMLYEQLRKAMDEGYWIYYHVRDRKSQYSVPSDSLMVLSEATGLIPDISKKDCFTGVIVLDSKALPLLQKNFTCLKDLSSALSEVTESKGHPAFKSALKALVVAQISYQNVLHPLRIEHHIYLSEVIGKHIKAAPWKIQALKRIKNLRYECNKRTRGFDFNADFANKHKVLFQAAQERIARLKARFQKGASMFDPYPMLSLLCGHELSSGKAEARACNEKIMIDYVIQTDALRQRQVRSTTNSKAA